MELLEKEGWMPGLNDIDCYLALDPTSLYVGELNGKPIAIAAMYKYDDQYRHFGCYIVDKAFRGRGYGMQLTAEVLRQSELNGIISLYSVQNMVEKYEKVMKAVPQWVAERHIVDIPTTFSFLKDAISSNASPPFSIKQVSDVDLKALFDYDTKVFGYKREKFVERLLQVGHARVALDQQNEIVGYAAARVLYNPDNGYRVGPVFCESIEIATYLLKELLQDLLQSGKSTKQALTIDIPLGNPTANEFAKILHGKIILKCVFACSNGLPKSVFKKWFAVTYVEAG
ncbi:uncharacterized protein LOC114516252 [Dendronephthya gigantea]|uniref:uncharacterized protein LOC114516252 n=1 Tax=Dendronephthya gigantea TaxID=151771 RepID=UPI00106A8ACF|nr:uncharacterized protein LOC114516252 [Dendronephthya gigantea]